MASAPQSEQLASTPKPPLPNRKGTEPIVQMTKDGREPKREKFHLGEKEEGQKERLEYFKEERAGKPREAS